MAAWWLTESGDYINAAATLSLTVAEISSGLWRVRAGTTSLNGDYASETDARDAARKLCQGVDPATITGAT